ncbi:cathepsin F-like [Oratosquilla oratoria]|uniref:cathepsin F-like n=1 Tax=Oratosquilla oratoria TaxID=337810 RepID=UPI003F757368
MRQSRCARDLGVRGILDFELWKRRSSEISSLSSQQTLYSLSEQELVDCDTLDQGCDGGLPDNAYQSIEKLGGLETEAAYPYDGEDEQCHLDESNIKVKVNGSVDIDQDEENIAKWLAGNGPVSIGINANALQFYMGGVSHPLKFLCNPEDLDHGMFIVGYGVHTTKYLHRRQPYWIVKNSWGPDWGEEGYYRVCRGHGTCGVNCMASSAIVP